MAIVIIRMVIVVLIRTIATSNSNISSKNHYSNQQ